MQKNDKSYTFLLSHSSNSRIYIKKVAVSKRFLAFGAAAIFLFIGITTLGIGLASVIANNPNFAEVVAKTSALTKVSAESIKTSENNTQTIEYSQPAEEPAELAENSGGPAVNDQASGEDLEIDNEVLAIRNSSDPANLPSMWAHLGKINNEFGFRRNPFGGRAYEFHPGMDIDGERGEPVAASGNGVVISAGYKGGYGNMVEIDHGNGITSRYGHMSKIEAEVGETVTRGTTIGQIGSTGRSTGPHLHFEVRLNDRPINPRHFLPQEPTELTPVAR